jgi:hypothetical protein
MESEEINKKLDAINKKFKYQILNVTDGLSWVLTSDRQVSKTLKDTYDIEISHMYIRRHLQESNYILRDNILIQVFLVK